MEARDRVSCDSELLDTLDQWTLQTFKDKTIAGDGKRYKDEQILAKRNARERGRVRAVNNAFSRLRLVVPAIAHRNKRVSKVKTLQKAIQYIMDLENLLYLPLNAECLYQHQYHSDL